MKLSERIKALRDHGEGAWRERINKGSGSGSGGESVGGSGGSGSGNNIQQQTEDKDDGSIVVPAGGAGAAAGGGVRDRLSKLEESQEGWRRRVPPKSNNATKVIDTASSSSPAAAEVIVTVISSRRRGDEELLRSVEDDDESSMASFEEYVSMLEGRVEVLPRPVDRPRRKKTRKPHHQKKKTMGFLRPSLSAAADGGVDEGVRHALESVEDYGGVELKKVSAADEEKLPSRVLFQVVQVGTKFAQVREVNSSSSSRASSSSSSSCYVLIKPREGVVYKIRCSSAGGGGLLRCRSRMEEFVSELIDVGEYGLGHSRTRVVVVVARSSTEVDELLSRDQYGGEGGGVLEERVEDSSSSGDQDVGDGDEGLLSSPGAVAASVVVAEDKLYVWGKNNKKSSSVSSWSVEEEGVLWDASVVEEAWQKGRVLLFVFGGVEWFLLCGRRPNRLGDVDLSGFSTNNVRVVCHRGVEPPAFKFKFVNWANKKKGHSQRHGGGGGNKFESDESHHQTYVKVGVPRDDRRGEKFTYDGVVVGDKPGAVVLNEDEDCLLRGGYRVRLSGVRCWRLTSSSSSTTTGDILEEMTPPGSSGGLLFRSGGVYVVRVCWSKVEVRRRLVTKEETECVVGRSRSMWFLFYGAGAKVIDKGRIAGVFSSNQTQSVVSDIYRTHDDSPGMVVVDEGACLGTTGLLPFFVGVWGDRMVIEEEDEVEKGAAADRRERRRLFYLVRVGPDQGEGEEEGVSWYLREVPRKHLPPPPDVVDPEDEDDDGRNKSFLSPYYSYVSVSSGGDCVVVARNEREREVIEGCVAAVVLDDDDGGAAVKLLFPPPAPPLPSDDCVRVWRFGVVRGLVCERVWGPLTATTAREILTASDLYPCAIYIETTSSSSSGSSGSGGHLILRLWGGVEWNPLRRAILESVGASNNNFTVEFYKTSGSGGGKGRFSAEVSSVFPYPEEEDEQEQEEVLRFQGEAVLKVLEDVKARRGVDEEGRTLLGRYLTQVTRTAIAATATADNNLLSVENVTLGLFVSESELLECLSDAEVEDLTGVPRADLLNDVRGWSRRLLLRRTLSHLFLDVFVFLFEI